MLPSMKAVWCSSIMDGSTFFSLLDNSLAIILYMHLINEIGLYPLRLWGSWTLGIKAKNDALLPFRNTPLI